MALQQKWLGQAGGNWSPRCVIVLHASRAAYCSAVGRGGERSFGSTWIGTQRGKISQRRVDLLADTQGQITALGHELTHVVLADAFTDRSPPPWAGEGIALLSDSAEKQARHAQDVRQAIHSGAAFGCHELLTLDAYPSPDRIPAFYGQSASLVKLLCQCGKPEDLVRFLKLSQEVGYDCALAQTYGIAGTVELARLWERERTSLLASHTP